MRITKKIRFEEYWRDKRFNHRKDSLYYEEDGQLKRKKVFPHDEEGIKHDLEGEFVLISEEGDYYYFGGNAIAIPEQFRNIIKKGPSHKWNFDAELVANFLQWIKDNCKKGKCGEPYVKEPREKC